MAEPTVMVVQHEATERSRTVASLSRCCDPARIAAVATAAEAIDFLGGRGQHAGRDPRKLPRLLLMDLPREEGLGLLDQVRRGPRTAGLPVIALLEGGDREAHDEWYRRGANSVVGKTASEEELHLKMKRLHDFWVTVNEPNRSSKV